MIKERKYEVIKFVEHNGKCRIVMDCIPGRLLVYRMQDADGPAKDEGIQMVWNAGRGTGKVPQMQKGSVLPVSESIQRPCNS